MNQEQEKEGIIYSKVSEKTKPSLKDALIIITLILLVVGLGMLAANQTLKFFYKSQFLQTPCSLCKELNPNAPININAPRINNINLTYNASDFIQP
jgi:hypothetical protein